MGICIHLEISKSVTEEEWKIVYEDSLKLVKALPFADQRMVDLEGFDIMCLTRTEEYSEPNGPRDSKPWIGWHTVGDYEYLHIAEGYSFPRDIVDEKEYVKECGDAIYGALPGLLDYDWNDKRFACVYSLWRSKTQGEPYHMYLLAVACMAASRLSTKAFLHGDITKGQCIEAVRIANEILDIPIDTPDNCNPTKLLSRINTLSIPAREKIIVFSTYFLGDKGSEFGEFIRENFSGRAFNGYWKKRFDCFNVSQLGFESAFREYMLWGFELDKLSRFLNFNGTENEISSQYENFVIRVMDAKLHLREKDCSDALEIDQNNSTPYSVMTYFAQLFFSAARNKKIDRYIPLEDIRKALVKGIGNKCNVNQIIDEYILKEAEQKK